MVGRLELLTPERERLAEARRRATSPRPTPRPRGRAFDVLRDQGRYVEPIVRRVLRTTDDERVRTLCRRLLATDFVTDLRSAVHAAADGRARSEDDPVFVRAQLAGLLREVGLDAEAKAEGAAALAALKARPEPPMSHPDARQYLRAVARALEGIGDDPGAARDLRPVHPLRRPGPDEAGMPQLPPRRRPARHGLVPRLVGGRAAMPAVARTGRRPGDRRARGSARATTRTTHAARLMLAYLYGTKGERARPRHWSALIAPEKAELAAAPQTPRPRPSAGTP